MLPTESIVTALKAKARELGFDLVGVAPVDRSAREAYWRRWLAEGKAGSMGYLAARIEERLDPQVYFPEARSAVCVAMNYHVPLEASPPRESRIPGRIARYALPEDYHETIKGRLLRLADYLKELVPGSVTRAAVDTAPVPERELAARAGIGWVGKNTCVLNTGMGSWLFLGTVLTSAELPLDGATPDRCGTCTRCLDACPTGALTPERPYELDATRCISYLTIEHRGEISPDLQPLIGDWLYGCDICQDVCPWNRKAPATTDPDLQPRIASGTVDAREVLTWDRERWLEFSRHTAIRRLGLPLLQRNAAIVVQNADRDRTPGQRTAE